jgi:apolipoprotein N-acyltransferase
VKLLRAIPSILQSRYLWAVLSGLVLAVAFPPFNVAGFAWLAPGLMVAAAREKSGAQRFRIGYVAGIAYYLTTLYWLLLIPYRWHGLPLGPALGWVSLSAFLALCPATWVFVLRGPRPVQTGTGASTLWHGLPATWLERTAWALGGAAAWVCFEFFLAHFLCGFPWDLLGVSQWKLTPLIQVASVTGVYGLSFLVSWFSLSLVSATIRLVRQPYRRSAWLGEFIVPALVVAFLFSWGFQRTKTGPGDERARETLRVMLVQPSIPQSVIWDQSTGEARFGEMLQLCENGMTNNPDLVIWPEAAVPGFLYETNNYYSITAFARKHHVWMILCADAFRRRPDATGPDDVDFFNSSMLISPEGEVAGQYNKRDLVIFGEYVPFQRALPFLKWFTPITGGYTPGDSAAPFRMRVRDTDIKTSVLICYEDVFPQLGRDGVDTETDFLVNLTNDGWFGLGAAQWQQALTGLFRTVENDVPLIRCTNNGLTCWVDSRGRMRQVFKDGQGGIYGPGVMAFELPLREKDENRRPTFYNQHGDWFGWACFIMAPVFIAFSRRRA